MLMNNAGNTTDSPAHDAHARVLKHPAVRALAAVLIVECLALVAAVVFLIVELLVAPVSSVASAVGITLVVAIAAVWVAFIAIGVLRGSAWTRAAVLVLQILIAAVAIGSFQGADARPDLGLILLVPVVTALALVFTRPVVAATSVRELPRAY